MTEHDLDDLASDLLDGLLPADRAADALRDPAVARRVAEMRAAQALLRDVAPPAAARRESVLAAALDATPQPVGGRDRVADLAAHRSQRRWRDPRWLTAAAVALVVLAFGGLVAANSTGNDDTDSAAQSSDEASGGDAGTADAGTASAGGETDTQAQEEAMPTTTTATPAAPSQADANLGLGERPDLGDAGSLGQLADRARADTEEGADTSDQARATADAEALASTVAEPCPPPEQVEGADAIELNATARLDGVPVVVWVVREGDSRRMIVVDPACAVVGERTLAG